MEFKNWMRPKKLIWTGLFLVSLVSIAQDNPGQDGPMQKENTEIPAPTSVDDVPAFGNEAVGKPEEPSSLEKEFDSATPESATSQSAKTDSATGDTSKKETTSGAPAVESAETDAVFSNHKAVPVQEEQQSASTEENNLENTTDNPRAHRLVIDETPQQSGEVKLVREYDYSLPYKQRRGKHGVLFGMSSEKFEPKDYTSGPGDSYFDQFTNGSEVDLLGVDLGYKFNFGLGSLSALFDFGFGKLSRDSSPTESRNIEFRKYGLSANFAMDNLMNEPWVVPYGQLGVHQFLIKDTSSVGTNDTEVAATTGIGINYRVGLLFQLNWIESAMDSTTHTEGLRTSGLENTYLDVFLSWHQPMQDVINPADDSTQDNEPDTTSSAKLGIGLKLEF